MVLNTSESAMAMQAYFERAGSWEAGAITITFDMNVAACLCFAALVVGLILRVRKHPLHIPLQPRLLRPEVYASMRVCTNRTA